MTQCDWCESKCLVRHFVQTPEGLKNISLCSTCAQKSKEIPRDLIENMNEIGLIPVGIGGFSSSYSAIGLFDWLVPKMMD